MNQASFDTLAPHYEWIEKISFSSLLLWCRTALIGEIKDSKRILILGEGDGRFLASLLSVNKEAIIDVVESSSVMVLIAQRRLTELGLSVGAVNWYVIDAQIFEPEEKFYNLVVANFFLDCFTSEELAPLLNKYSRSLISQGKWLIGDFAVPTSPLLRPLARLLLTVMYLFFKITTSISAIKLVDPRPILKTQNFILKKECKKLNGFVTAQIWQLGSQAL